MAFSVKLIDGKWIPAIAWGNASAGMQSSGSTAVEIGAAALNAGILHIDTAQGYGTEAETRQAVEASGIPREKVWITTKLSPLEDGVGVWPPGYRERDIKTTEASIRHHVEKSIADLGGAPDLLLIHSPYVPEKGKIGQFWTILETLVKDGTLRGTSLGVSNFRPQDLRDVLEVATIKPVLQQIEYHPYVLAHLDELRALQAEHEIVTAAYGPLTPILRHPGGPLKPVLRRIADDHAIDPATVLLRWVIQSGAVVITTSSSLQRVSELLKVYEVELTQAEMDEIERVGRTVYFRSYTEHMGIDFPAPDLPDGLN